MTQIVYSKKVIQRMLKKAAREQEEKIARMTTLPLETLRKDAFYLFQKLTPGAGVDFDLRLEKPLQDTKLEKTLRKILLHLYELRRHLDREMVAYLLKESMIDEKKFFLLANYGANNCLEKNIFNDEDIPHLNSLLNILKKIMIEGVAPQTEQVISRDKYSTFPFLGQPSSSHLVESSEKLRQNEELKLKNLLKQVRKMLLKVIPKETLTIILRQRNENKLLTLIQLGVKDSRTYFGSEDIPRLRFIKNELKKLKPKVFDSMRIAVSN